MDYRPRITDHGYNMNLNSKNEEMLVQMRGVTKRFGEATAVANITLDVPRGAILGFIGPSGCWSASTSPPGSDSPASWHASELASIGPIIKG